MTINIKRSATESLMRDIITKIAVGPDRGKDITKHEAYEATKFLLNNKLDETHAALFLIGLRMKRESMLEYAGIFKAIEDSTPQIEIDLPNLVYLAEPYDGYKRGTPIAEDRREPVRVERHHEVEGREGHRQREDDQPDRRQEAHLVGQRVLLLYGLGRVLLA